MRACLCMGACWISRLNQTPWVLIPLEDVVRYHIPLLQVKKKKKLITCPVCVSHPAWTISQTKLERCQVRLKQEHNGCDKA